MLPRDFVLFAFLLVFAGAGLLALIYAPLMDRTPPRWVSWPGYGLVALVIAFGLVEITGLGCRIGL